MKLIVKRVFIDRFTGQACQPGEILDWKDDARTKDCIARGLVAEAAEPEKVAPIMPEPEPEAEEKPSKKKAKRK